METKDTTSVIDRKLAEVMAEVAYVAKSSRNDFHKYNYASAEAVISKVNQALSSRQMSVTASSEIVEYLERDGKIDAVVSVTLTIRDQESPEEFRIFQGLGAGRDSGDKAIMKATTAAHKYAYALGFCISWGDDPEADSSTDSEKSPKKVRKPRKPRASKAAPPAPARKVVDSTQAEAFIDSAAKAKDAQELQNLRSELVAKKVEATPEMREAYIKRKNELETESSKEETE